MKSNFFMTHHSPAGAWSSLTFGLPGHGASIGSERLRPTDDADLLIALSQGPGETRFLPFATSAKNVDEEALNLLSPAQRSGTWIPFKSSEVSRDFSPSVDSYSAAGLTFKVYSPAKRIPDIEQDSRADISYAICPGLLIELEIDNSKGEKPVNGFLGLISKRDGRIHPLDWSGDGLCGIGFKNEWAFAARPVEGKVFTIKHGSAHNLVENGEPMVHGGGNEGGILIKAPPGEKTVLRAALGFYKDGVATTGMKGSYLYTEFFKSPAQVCLRTLLDAERIKSDCVNFDNASARRCSDPRRLSIFAQSLSAYLANSQLLKTEKGVAYSVCEGGFAWRNTLDLAADHLPWELDWSPWLVRNIMDSFIERHSYTDTLRFPGEREFSRAGGLAFTHDQGNYTDYSVPGYGGYELTNATGYAYMTTEQVLNGVFCLCSYLLKTGDAKTFKRWRPTLLALLESIRNRDNADAAKRDGLLKGESSRCGDTGHEITTYDCLDESVCKARGNLYIHIKAWCSCLMLESSFLRFSETANATACKGSADLFAKAILSNFRSPDGSFLHANALNKNKTLMSAALDPLGISYWLALGPELEAYPELLEALRKHAVACLTPGACIEPKTGGLLLSSSSDNSWPSKGILIYYAISKLLGEDADKRWPSLMREFVNWTQVLAADVTISDQVMVSEGSIRGAFSYPRIITASLWLEG